MAGGKKTMSRAIDQRIVDMRFNNKQFESGIKESLGSLDRLKKGLNLDQATASLRKLGNAGQNFSLSGMASGISHISGKFSALGAIGFTVLQNLTNAAVNFAKQTISSFTIEPITSGFREYETQMNAVQTILANTQGTQRAVNQQAVRQIKDRAALETQEVLKANTASVGSTNNSLREKTRALERASKKETNILRDQHQEAERLLDKRLDKDLDALDKYHRKARTLLEDSLEAEMDALNETHSEKLNLYEEEFMAKLKVIDEERYLRIKQIDDEINALQNLTKAEEEALEKAEDQQRIGELTENVNQTTNVRDRMRAEKALADFKARISRKELLKSRDNQIEMLENTKTSIEEEYDLRVEELRLEHQLKIDNATIEHDESTKLLRTEHSERLLNLETIQETEKENLSEQHRIKKRDLNDLHETEMDNMRERHQKERDNITDRQAASSGGANTQQAAALKAIEDRKNAELKALNEAAKVAGTPSTLLDVDEALDELNRYADQTIYSFTEMARNIGTFTAAGVDLDTSVGAIKGIANLAAVSGSTSQQASTAMYQLSQAISTGSVRLMDWNSVVNAGMGGRVFQQALKETARAHGVAIDEIIMDQGSFRDSLQTGWLHSDILLDTLKKFTGDLTAEQLKSKGYNDEQIASILQLGQTAKEAATTIRTFSQLMGTLREATQSGWAQSWEIIVGDFEEAKILLTSISDAVGGYITKTAEARNEMLKFWDANQGRENLISALSTAFGHLSKLITPIVEAFKEFFPPLTGKRLVEITNSFKAFVDNIKIGEPLIDNIRRTFRGVFALASLAIDFFKAVFNGIVSILSPLGDGGKGLISFTAVIGDFLVSIEKFIKENDMFNKVIGGMATIIETTFTSVSEAINVMIEYFNTLDFSVVTNFVDGFINSFTPITTISTVIENAIGGITFVIQEIINFFIAFGNEVSRVFTNIKDGINSVLKDLGLDEITINFDTVLSAINALIGTGILIGIKKFIDSLRDIADNAGGFLAGITDVLDGVKGSLEAYQNNLKAGALLKIAMAIGVLALALLLLSLIDPEKLTGALIAITTLFANLFGSMYAFGKLLDGKAAASMVALSFMFIMLGGALLLFANALLKFGNIDTKVLIKGMVTMGLVLAQLAIFTKKITTPDKIVATGFSLILLAVALNLFARAIASMGQLSIEEIGKGLTTMAGALAIIALGIHYMPDSTLVKAKGLTVLAFGMNILARSLAKLGKIPLEDMLKGLFAMAGIMFIIAKALKTLPPKMGETGFALILIGIALLLISEALESFASLSLEEMGKGLLAMGLSLGIIVGAVHLMGEKGLAGAAAFLIIATAINILAVALGILGSLSLVTIGTGLLALAGIFGILGLAGLLLKPVIIPIMLLAGAVALLGIGIGAIGGGTLMLAAGIAALAVSVGVGSSAITAILDLIPLFFKKLGEGIVAYIESIGNNIKAIIKVVREVLTAVIDLLVEMIPKFVTALLELIVTLLDTLAENVPKMIKAGMDLTLGILDGIWNNIAELAKAGVKIIVEFLNGVSSKLPDVIDAAFKMIISFINGLADAIRNNSKLIMDVCENLIDAIIDSLTGMIGRFNTIGQNIITGIMDGIKNMGRRLTKAVTDVVDNSIKGIKNFLGIDSPSKVFAEIGRDSISGLVLGINDMSKAITSSTKRVGNNAIKGISDVICDISDYLSADMSMNPVIRPVIDMSEVDKGLNKTFNKQQKLNVSSSMSKASAIYSPHKLDKGEITGGQTHTENIDSSRIAITNNFVVRNDSDIRKISHDLRNILDRYNYAKGVMVQ